MALFFGNQEIKAIYHGGTKITAVYKGSQLVWSGETEPTEPTQIVVTYTDGTTSYIDVPADGVITSSTIPNKSTVQTVVLPEGVTGFAMNAFNSCSSLTSINIPEGVTFIGYSAFSKCTSLTSINIPKSVTNISSDTFIDCTALTDIYCAFSEGAVSGAPWGAKNATIHYDYTG